MKRVDVVALYVDKLGPYPNLVADWWDERRDARLYNGPLPIVAHPPCGPWANLKHLYEGSEHDSGPRAVEQVRAFGGVLEHPKGSKLWDHCGLPDPGCFDGRGWTFEVEQCAWGHVARKKTWLYVAGVPGFAVGAEIRRGGKPTHWVSGRRGMGRASANVPPGIKVCSAQQRRRTPEDFAAWLLDIAARARVSASRAA